MGDARGVAKHEPQTDTADFYTKSGPLRRPGGRPGPASPHLETAPNPAKLHQSRKIARNSLNWQDLATNPQVKSIHNHPYRNLFHPGLGGWSRACRSARPHPVPGPRPGPTAGEPDRD